MDRIWRGALDAELLDSSGVLRLLPASHYDGYPASDLANWCRLNGRSLLPTTELVDWLTAFIGPRTAIEIGAGHGDLSYHLNIQATDSYMHELPDVQQFYRISKTPLPRYPPRVERLDAYSAIEKYKPQIVIAGWVDEFVDLFAPPMADNASVHGVEEVKIISSGITYVLIGHLRHHHRRCARLMQHRDFPFPWLRSCDPMQALNRVWVWN